jgi:glycosyltransferase involved in cell wall biosynthesis
MRIIVIANKYWEVDPRLEREVNALAEEGYDIDLILPQNPEIDNIDFGQHRNAITAYSLTLRRKRGSKIRYASEYLLYFIFTTIVVSWLTMVHKPRMIQVFVMPEFLMLSCWLAKLLHIPILMDWMDPMREVFLSEYSKSRSFRLILFLIDIFERCAFKIATHIITPNEGFRRAFLERGVPKSKISIIMNSADTDVFVFTNSNSHSLKKEENINVLLTGSIVPRGGLDIAIHAFEIIIRKNSSVKLIVVGDGKGEYFSDCKKLVEKLDLNNNVDFVGRVLLQQLPEIIMNATVTVISNRDTEFTRINFPTRISEFATMKKPMILPNLPGILDYLKPGDACFYQAENYEELAECVINLIENKQLREKYGNNGYIRNRSYLWSNMKQRYKEIVTQIMQKQVNV